MSSKFSKVFCLLLVANCIFLAAGSMQSFGKIIATCVQKLDYSVDKLTDMAETKTDEDGCFLGCIMAEYGTINQSGQLMKVGVDMMVEQIPDPTVREHVRASLNKFENLMEKATDPCSAGKIAQSFAPAMNALKLMMTPAGK